MYNFSEEDDNAFLCKLTFCDMPSQKHLTNSQRRPFIEPKKDRYIDVAREVDRQIDR